MTDVAASTTVNTVTQVKKDKKTERPKATPHPTTAVMVNNAIQNLKERGGSSLQAIKKYISATYKIDGDKFSPFIKKYLKASVAAGTLVQTKGKGASGSFKLASSAVTKKPTTVDKPKKVAAKPAPKPKGRITTEKPTSAELKKSAPVKSAKTKKAAAVVEKKKPVVQAAAKSKSPSKAKKTTKAPTKKPKSPKPKTTKPKVAKKKASPKKK